MPSTRAVRRDQARWTVCWATLTAALVLTSCSSSGAKPVPSAAVTQSQTAPASTRAASPSPAPTSAPPVSPFESDPAVMAMRAWAVQAAKTVNSGAYDDAALDALMTPELAKTMSHLLGGDVGLHYPGPLPFTPLSITSSTATEHDFQACVVATGFAVNPATQQPAAARVVQAANIGAQLVNGTWLVSKQDAATFSCDGVAIPEPKS